MSAAFSTLISAGKPPLFEVKLVALSKKPHVYEKLFTVIPQLVLKDTAQADLIIIPALKDALKKSLELNRDFFPWITEQYRNGSEVASLCLGAFILASTGLLNGKRCATHWTAAEEFRQLFPEVNLVDDKIITDEKGIYTSGGAFSYLNLVIYLIEKYAGHDAAIFCTKIYEIEIERNSQLPFVIFNGQKEHGDEQVKKAQEFIEQNFQDRITVDQLASILAVSRRSLERRFKKATAGTVVEYIQRVKIEAAKKQFEISPKNVNEVMYDVGYTDAKAFRTVFKKITGLSPIDYRNKYNKEAAVA